MEQPTLQADTTYFLNNARSHNAWAENIANALCHTNIWETIQSAITLIQRHESKIWL